MFSYLLSLFSFKKSVPSLLASGRTWVEDLSTAAEETEVEAADLYMEAAEITALAESTSEVAKEGKAVAANFRNMLRMDVED